MKYRLLHFHTDPKFLNGTILYAHQHIENEIIFLGKDGFEIDQRIVDLNIKMRILENTQSSIKDITHILDNYDAFICYGLTHTEIQLLKEIPKGKKVFLRFFGFELYNKEPARYLSSKTLKYIDKPKLNKSIRIYTKQKLKNVFNAIFGIEKKNQRSLFEKINAVIFLNKVEYEELRQQYYLPQFIQLPFVREPRFEASEKKNIIIIGNSRHYWNNHLDIIEIINNIEPPVHVQYNLFFNYGPINAYSEKVKTEAKKNKQVNLIESFLPKKEFTDTYKYASALVINSYRQHAVGNIITALINGCKVYLNPKSSTYKWLLNEGFVLSEINSLKQDILHNKYFLAEEEKVNNLNAYHKMRKKYTQEAFQKEILQILGG